MTTTFDPIPLLIKELELPERGVAATVRLLTDGGTVPFIARYRKEATGGLDEVQIRSIEERRAYVLELEERRQSIVKAIDLQGKLTDELLASLRACDTKTALEDLYLPYKKKRRTRATIARERGLEPLAQRILEQPADGHPKAEAEAYVDVDNEIPDREAALAGARDIVAEVVAEVADIRTLVRRVFFEQGAVVSKRIKAKTKGPTKFEQYYDFSERVQTIPSHRYLAIRRGENEGVLRATIAVDADRLCTAIEGKMSIRPGSTYGMQLSLAVRDSFKRLIAPSVENDVRAQLKERSDTTAVEIFADNLHNLLLAAPLGTKAVIGIDPGLRTGCKCTAVDTTGKFLDTVTIQLSKTAKEKEKAHKKFLELTRKHAPAAVAVGNGTGGREAEAWVRRVLAAEKLDDIIVVPVNESGASIYSASDVAREEFPDLDLTIRGAISIARRLQDPLAELVKIDPKSIGVGQYQHDVHQPLLQRKLGVVVESCVNHVGVALATAS
ncbi:MAG: Tex-like N-terminal domain-containing protein, partial [Myxococcota bacterium]